MLLLDMRLSIIHRRSHISGGIRCAAHIRPDYGYAVRTDVDQRAKIGSVIVSTKADMRYVLYGRPGRS